MSACFREVAGKTRTALVWSLIDFFILAAASFPVGAIGGGKFGLAST